MGAKRENSRAGEVELENVVDKTAEKVVELLGKTTPVRRIRNSQLLSALFGVVGLALFIVGVEKLFADFSGWFSIGVGLILMAAAGVVLQKLK